MKKTYQIIDQPGDHAFTWCTPINDVLEEGEVSAIIKKAGNGFGAYLREHQHWDIRKVSALLERYKGRGLRAITNRNATSPCRIAINAPEPDEVMSEFVEEFKREIIKDPTLEFRIKDGYVYGIRVSPQVPSPAD